jgi:hypothetical protein
MVTTRTNAATTPGRMPARSRSPTRPCRARSCASVHRQSAPSACRLAARPFYPAGTRRPGMSHATRKTNNTRTRTQWLVSQDGEACRESPRTRKHNAARWGHVELTQQLEDGLERLTSKTRIHSTVLGAATQAARDAWKLARGSPSQCQNEMPAGTVRGRQRADESEEPKPNCVVKMNRPERLADEGGARTVGHPVRVNV